MQINTTSDALDNLNKKLGGADIEIEPSTNKVDALKKIYKTLGGTDDVSGLSTVFQVLEKITEVAEGGGGGGGSSDFSAAQVTIINNSHHTVSCAIPVANADYNDAECLQQIDEMTTNTYNVILFMGAAYVNINLTDVNITLSGDIEDTGSNSAFNITGDGLILLS